MWIAAIVFLVLVIPIVFSHTAQLLRSHKAHAKGIVNHDAGFREFIYRVDKSGEEIWNIIKRHDTYTTLKYRFHEKEGAVTFYPEIPDGRLHITYGICISERDGSTVLRVVQRNHLWEKNEYCWYQNEFWHQLLGAEPIPYTQRQK